MLPLQLYQREYEQQVNMSPPVGISKEIEDAMITAEKTKILRSKWRFENLGNKIEYWPILRYKVKILVCFSQIYTVIYALRLAVNYQSKQQRFF